MSKQEAERAKRVKESYDIASRACKDLLLVFLTSREVALEKLDNKKFTFEHVANKTKLEGITAYDHLHKQHAIPAERIERVNKLFAYMEKEGVKNFKLMTEMGYVKKINSVNDKFKLVTFDFLENFTCVKGQRDLYSVGEVAQRGVVISVLDRRTNEILTEYTDFKELEVIKEIEKTRIVKQEVKSGIDKNKIEKALRKALTDTNRLAGKKRLSMDNPAMQEELVKNILQRLG